MASSDREAPTGYVVDVCRYCGRLAVWPGCEHWQKHDGWTLAVSVKLTTGSRKQLQAAMVEAGRVQR